MVRYRRLKHGHVNTVSKWPYSPFHRYVDQGILSSTWGQSGIDFDEDSSGE